MAGTGNHLAQIIFLTTLLSGDSLLIASLVIARLNWRADVPPYGLRTRVLDVFFHADEYVLPKAAALFRLLFVLGWLLVMVAILTIAHQAVVQFLR